MNERVHGVDTSSLLVEEVSGRLQALPFTTGGQFHFVHVLPAIARFSYKKLF